MKANTKRYYWVDLMRILACIAVIGLHVCSADLWYNIPVTSSRWIADNFYGSLTKWCVPVFIMISGMIFLNPKKKVTVKSIYTKYIPHLALLYVIWSTIYVLCSNFRQSPNFNVDLLKDFVGQFVKGHYHLWYIYTIIGIYMFTPLLRKMVENCSKRMLEYFLILWIAFYIIIPTITLFPHTGLIRTIVSSLRMSYVTSLIGYYILGYYLSIIPITKTTKRALYMCGIIGAILTVGISTYMSLASGKPNRVVHGNSSPNVFLMAVGVFAFYRETVSKIKLGDMSKKIILQISSCSLGIYLCHPLFLALLNKIGLKGDTIHPIISVPLTVLATFSLSFIFTLVVNIVKLKIIHILHIQKAENENIEIAQVIVNKEKETANVQH